jgi:hypothetical protein
MNYFTTGGNVPSANRFDPNAGVNLALTNASNLSNYYANIYGADQARAGAEKAASASKTSGALGAAASLGGSAMIAFAL